MVVQENSPECALRTHQTYIGDVMRTSRRYRSCYHWLPPLVKNANGRNYFHSPIGRSLMMMGGAGWLCRKIPLNAPFGFMEHIYETKDAHP